MEFGAHVIKFELFEVMNKPYPDISHISSNYDYLKSILSVNKLHHFFNPSYFNALSFTIFFKPMFSQIMFNFCEQFQPHPL